VKRDKPSAAIKQIERTWNRQLWGFYRTENNYEIIRPFKCFFCHHVQLGTLDKISAGTAPCGYSYKCNNCCASTDAEFVNNQSKNALIALLIPIEDEAGVPRFDLIKKTIADEFEKRNNPTLDYDDY